MKKRFRRMGAIAGLPMGPLLRFLRWLSLTKLLKSKKRQKRHLPEKKRKIFVVSKFQKMFEPLPKSFRLVECINDHWKFQNFLMILLVNFEMKLLGSKRKTQLFKHIGADFLEMKIVNTLQQNPFQIFFHSATVCTKIYQNLVRITKNN